MTEQPKIILYDLISTLREKSVFLFVFRIRLFLDYKKIPYETIWIDFPDVAATAKAIGASPTSFNADGNPVYTVPMITVTYPDKPTFALSGAVAIATYLEKIFPDPQNTLLPEENRVFQALFTKYLTDKVLSTVFRTHIRRLILVIPEHCREWFIESRKYMTGATLNQISPLDEASIAQRWKSFEAAFDDLAAYLDHAGEGNFRITGGVSYAELELISLLNLVKRTSFDEGWKRLKDRNGGRWAKLLDLPVYQDLLPANRVKAVL